VEHWFIRLSRDQFVVKRKFDQGHELEMKALQAEIAELKETLKSAGLERAEKHQPCADLKSTVYKKPEDVIRVFMMNELVRGFLMKRVRNGNKMKIIETEY
jgi:hypothetical protein